MEDTSIFSLVKEAIQRSMPQSITKAVMIPEKHLLVLETTTPAFENLEDRNYFRITEKIEMQYSHDSLLREIEKRNEKESEKLKTLDDGILKALAALKTDVIPLLLAKDYTELAELLFKHRGTSLGKETGLL